MSQRGSSPHAAELREYDANLNKYKWTNDILINKNISIVSISANDFVGFDKELRIYVV